MRTLLLTFASAQIQEFRYSPYTFETAKYAHIFGLPTNCNHTTSRIETTLQGASIAYMQHLTRVRTWPVN